MSRRRQRMIEAPSGSGTLVFGEKSVPVEYALELSVTELETMPGEWIDGLKSIEGAVEADDEFALIPLFDHADLTLHMEDGRSFDCSLSRVQGRRGRVIARSSGRPEGPLYHY
jgi:hypothetical protein